MNDYVIGIDIGGTKCAVVLGEAGEADEDCRIFDRVCFATEARRGPDHVIHDLFGAVRALLGHNEIRPEKLQIGERPSFCQSFEQIEELSAKTVALAAKSGDPLALDIYETSAYYLGRGLAILIDILNPEIIVLGSVYERSEELLWPCAQRVIEQEALAISREGCRIVPAELGNKIGDYAALSVAIQGGKNGKRTCSI